jgi:hypothetical protein
MSDSTSNDMINANVEIYFAKIKKLANKIIKKLQHEVFKLGFQSDEITLKSADEAIYRLEKDTVNDKYSLVGDWRDEKGIKIGSLLFHSEEHFFVEQDIIKPHPNDKRFFVEAVNAWGKSGNIKAEARLIARLG